ncbi:stage II sporulation protein D [Fonticella tunisiensis]|uniref:Stage II sporulation protein D n=1 Tax=Fonticella tunisiensis TaxID=1096341 RepID=A0A4R7KTM4_9CLOT|nr:stage II sporulation protein D [Fonticella tunisiensis]
MKGGKLLRRILIYILSVILLTLFIPIIILGNIGEGIGLPQNIIPQAVSNSSKGNDESIKIKVYMSKTTKKIEEMDLEEYVKGVVAAEMPASWGIEALKAQAIAARTYAVARMSQFGGKESHEGAAVCDDVHCQAWISKEDRMKNWDLSVASEYWNKIENAVEATRGQIMTYDGKLASLVKYFSTSNGWTENSKEVFGYEAPYLVSVESSGEEVSKTFKSTKEISKADFIKKMVEYDNKIKKEGEPELKLSSKTLSTEIKILGWTEGKRVKAIKIGNKTYSGVDVRWAMGLSSADFNVKVTSSKVIFDVRGNGHGVGMSQWGAKAMADKGSKYDEILKHYYTGIAINKISDISKK